MKSTLLSRRDLDFLLYEWLQVDELTKRDRFAEHSRETFDAVLDLCEQLATRYFAPHNKKSDAQEPRFDGEKVTVIGEVKEALDAFTQADLVGMAMDGEFGGAQLPMAVASAGFAWFSAANISTTGYLMLTIANANLLAKFGTSEQIDAFLRPMLAGRFSGTMALSETQAGSSLADIMTRAEPQDDGTYRLFGSKMWISGAEHELTENIVNLVLAKIPGGPPGTKGISLFIVPKYLVGEDGSVGERNDVVLAGLNHKMGQRGITNTVLNFGEGRFTPGGQPGAVGYLVGEPHRGLTYMFHMMNEARLGVGMGAVSLGYTGYLKSLQYARERPQGRPVTAKDPAAPQVPIIEHADVKRMLLAQKAYVEGGMALLLYCAKLVDLQHSAETDEDARCDDAASRYPDADRQELALAVVSGGQQPGDPGTRRLRLHPRVRRRTASTATTASTPSTKAPTASRAWTCWAARSPSAAAPAWPRWGRPSVRPWTPRPQWAARPQSSQANSGRRGNVSST